MNIIKAIFLLIVLSTSFPVNAGETSPSSVGPGLPSKIRTLLIEEMIAINDAMGDILTAIVKGQDEVVADKAQAIHDSFIIKKEMKPEDKERLIESVPEKFVKRDKEFHELSAELAAAAFNGNKSLQIKNFTKMVNSCVDCHSHHATHRFPGFAEEKE